MRYLFTIIFFSAGIGVAAQKNSKPNIIFILADDLGYAEVGCYGQQKIETPNIDKLAKNGLRFTQFYSGSTVCAPARASFLTGLHTGHTAIRGNKQFLPEGQTPLPDSVITFVNLLQKNGYATAAFGKWGLGHITNSGDPNKKGFDEFYGYTCQSLAHDYFPMYVWDNHQQVDLGVNKTSDSVYAAELIHSKAIQYIQRTGTKPFFIYLPYTLPHGDVIGPHDEFYSYYAKKFNEQPLTGVKLRTRPHNTSPEPLPHAQFAAMVARLDKYVGEIVKAVADKGLAENTLIIFTSDNGPHKENGGDPEFFNSNGILKGIKRDLYEGGIRVPFIAYWPDKIRPGITGQTAALWDIYPSLLSLAGVGLPNKTDGYSLLPTFFQKGKQRQHEYFYWEFHELGGRQAVRLGNWKGIRLAVNENNDAAIELYDLRTDPREQNNIASKFPLVVRRIEAIMRQEHVLNPDWPLLKSEREE